MHSADDEDPIMLSWSSGDHLPTAAARTRSSARGACAARAIAVDVAGAHSDADEPVEAVISSQPGEPQIHDADGDVAST